VEKEQVNLKVIETGSNVMIGIIGTEVTLREEVQSKDP
jgi:hypothetical protein